MTGPWTITWRGTSWTDDELTTQQLVAVEALEPKAGWSSGDPFSSPSVLVAHIAVGVCARTGRELTEVLSEVLEAPALELINALSLRDLGD